MSDLARVAFERDGYPAVLRALEATGIVLVSMEGAIEGARSNPVAFVERLLGEAPVLVERQRIRAIADGRTFASGSMAAPFHTDSQTLVGAPPHVQIMVCVREAASGGESLYLDTWAFLRALETRDAGLYAALFDVPRRMPFYFGDVYGPTCGLRGGGLVFTHSPSCEPSDVVGLRLGAALALEPRVAVGARAGDVLLIDNHRVLHGRETFEDTGREFVRLLAWRTSHVVAPRALRERAGAASAVQLRALATESVAVRRAFGVVEPTPVETRRIFSALMEMLRGVSPGAVSANFGISEPELYELRDAFVLAGLSAIETESSAPHEGPANPSDRRAADRRDALARVRQRLKGGGAP